MKVSNVIGPNKYSCTQLLCLLVRPLPSSPVADPV